MTAHTVKNDRNQFGTSTTFVVVDLVIFFPPLLIVFFGILVVVVVASSCVVPSVFLVESPGDMEGLLGDGVVV
jgi:hypothetical protein